MTLAPRFLVDLLARYRVNRLRQRLRHQGNGAAEQHATLRSLLGRFEKTAFGRQHGLTASTKPEEFRARVPLRTTAEFRAWTERMAAGEADVLWPGRCRFYLYTAGTVDGAHKMLPATPDMLLHFRRGIAETLLLHVARTGGTEIFHGRHLHLGASTALTQANGVYAGYLDAVVPLALSEWSEKNIYAPGAELAHLPEKPEKFAAIATAFAARDVRLAAGTPTSVLALADALKERSPDEANATVRAVWPQFECALQTGALPDLLAPQLSRALGPGVARHEVYAAAEGVFAAQDGETGAGLRLLTDSGVYFEFLPLRELTDAPHTSLGARCVPIEEVREGEDYALVVTTPAGLCRCLVGDAVRIVSGSPPRLLFVGRTDHLLHAFGERVAERDVTAALIEVCQRNNWQPVNFHVAPYFERTVPRPQGCHEWWIELRPGTVRTPTGPLLAGELDAELGRRHRDYTARRANGALTAPVVRLVMPGTFAQWSTLHPAFGGPGKFARCRGDRQIADQLAGIARFHPGTQAPFGAERM